MSGWEWIVPVVLFGVPLLVAVGAAGYEEKKFRARAHWNKR